MKNVISGKLYQIGNTIYFDGKEVFSCPVQNELDILMFNNSINQFKRSLYHGDKFILKYAIEFEIESSNGLYMLNIKAKHGDDKKHNRIGFFVNGCQFVGVL